MSNAPLLPCPFCGFDGCYVRSSGVETEVYCQNCTAVGPMYVSDTFNDGPDDAKAIAAWNTRHKSKAEELFDQQIADYVKRGKP